MKDLNIVDCSQLSNEASLRGLASGLERAFCDTGSFQLKGPSVTRLLQKQPLHLCADLHGLPESIKEMCAIHRSEGNRGYFKIPDGGVSNQQLQRRRYDVFEAGIDNCSPTNTIEEMLYAPNDWLKRTDMTHRADAISTGFLEVAEEVGMLVSTALQQSPTFLRDRAQKTCSQIRYLFYPTSENQAVSDTSALGAHTDYELFTITLQSEAALEVYSEKERCWILCPIVSNAVTILLGDMVEVLSNGIFRASLHRVQCIRKPRYSVAFFFAPGAAAMIAPLPNFGTPHYAPVIFGNHLAARNIENYPHLNAKYKNGFFSDINGVGQGNPYKNMRLKHV